MQYNAHTPGKQYSNGNGNFPYSVMLKFTNGNAAIVEFDRKEDAEAVMGAGSHEVIATATETGPAVTKVRLYKA